MKKLPAHIAYLILASGIFSTPLLIGHHALANTTDQQCAYKTCFNKTLERQAVTLPLRSATLFTYLLFDVYSVALYAPETTVDILADAPRSLIFHYHREISRQQMIDGAADNLAENPQVKMADYQEELSQINSWYTDVKAGDRYELFYLPGQGLSLYQNDKLLGTVTSESPERSRKFAQDYFGIWLSKYPLSEDLRDALLIPLKKAEKL